MTDNRLHELYANLQKRLSADLDAARNANKNANAKGDESELTWLKLFDDHLPHRYRSVKGIVIDSNGDESDAIDIIIHDRQYTDHDRKHPDDLRAGGIGKSPIDNLVRADAVRIDPYRLRSAGPRDQNDVFYAHPKLREELTGAFMALGDAPERISTNPAVDWFVKANATTFDVRGEWQCLLLGGLSAKYAKAEVYAPALPALLQRPEIRSVFGGLTARLPPMRATNRDVNHAPGRSMIIEPATPPS